MCSILTTMEHVELHVQVIYAHQHALLSIAFTVDSYARLR